MFKCQKCDTISQPGASPTKVVTAVRGVDYETTLRRDMKRFTIESKGFETVSEIQVCSECAKSQSPTEYVPQAKSKLVVYPKPVIFE